MVRVVGISLDSSGRAAGSLAFMKVSHPEPRDGDLVGLLNARDGIGTVVDVRDGDTFTVFNIAWGYDLGDEYAHITTNASPFVPGQPIDFFFTDKVTQIRDASTGRVLYSRR